MNTSDNMPTGRRLPRMRLLIMLALAVALLTTVTVVRATDEEQDRRRAKLENLKILSEAYDRILDYYVDELDPKDVMESALQGMLASRRVDHRLQAALSLTNLGDASGAEVLRELLLQEPYLAERAENSAAWAPQRVSESRQKALVALVQLGLPPAVGVLEEMAEDDPDANLRAAAREVMARPEGWQGGG